MRQVIPAAKAEIAIGMKTAVLKATDQAIRWLHRRWFAYLA